MPVERSGEFDDLHPSDKDKPLIGDNVDATNEFGLSLGQNLPNHSMTQIGRGKYIAPVIRDVPLFRTKQSAYRYAGWLMTMADMLPDEDGAHSWEQVLHAIRNS